jgi:hypothetical protein
VFSLAQENPVLRPSSSAVAEQCAAALEPGVQSIPRPIVEEVIAALPDDDVGRLIGLVERVAARRWHVLVAEVGTQLAREPLLVGIASAAVAELVPPARWLVAMREATAHEAPGPVNVLASLLHPESVWSAEEIRAAHALASPLPQQLAAIDFYANETMTESHRDRARLVAGAVAPLLPIAEAPLTSRHLDDALELVGRGSEAGELCRLLLLSAVLRLDGLVPLVPCQN